MKTIELKNQTEAISIGANKQDIDISTLELIKIATFTTPQGGFTANDMANRLRILDAIEKISENTKFLTLEDSDFANLGKYVNETKWGMISRTIAEFVKLFNE